VTTTADTLRGHKLIPSEEVMRSWPDLYSTEHTQIPQKIIHAHCFIGACDWWLAELDRERRIAYGYVNLGDDQSAEWGYFDLAELASIAVTHPSGLALAVERDLLWTPKPFSEIEGAR
jgi:hypothetical protein